VSTSALPNRRVEGWRWSDLSAALAGQPPVIASGEEHIIARLAEGAGALKSIEVAPGERRVERISIGAAKPLDVRAVDIVVAEGGAVDVVIDQRGGDVALSLVTVRLGEGASLRQFVLADGARFARIETAISVDGQATKIELDGVYLAAAKRHADLTSSVTMNAEHAEVRQLVRGAARRGGRGVFQGKFKVERGAQKADARMAHNALLLEEGAEVFAKPELEIYADDVQCAHGNTAGQLDENAVFYLRSRGIPESEARAMITRAFLMEAVPGWLPDDIREEAEIRISAWLEAV
jgi:Fe-S cluster assembly protein SufD